MSQHSPEVVAAALKHLRQSDAALAAILKQVGPCQLRRQTNRYQSLLRAIIAQQISGSAARSIWARLQLAADSKTLTAAIVDRLDDEQLRGSGVSPQKLGYVRDLTRRVTSGELKLAGLHRRTDDEVIDALVQVKGIGVWTAQMFLMFSLGRPDVLPHGDLGIQNAIRKLYELNALPDRETCHRIATPWRPYATYASWYLWRSLELPVKS